MRYNSRIKFHYIAWDIKINLENLNEVNNGFTWMKCFTQGFHKMAKDIVQKWHALFRVEYCFSLLRK